MILDSDLAVAPEDLPKFYDALVEGVQAARLDGNQVGILERRRGAHETFGRLPLWLIDPHLIPALDQICLGDAVLAIGQEAKGTPDFALIDADAIARAGTRAHRDIRGTNGDLLIALPRGPSAHEGLRERLSR